MKKSAPTLYRTAAGVLLFVVAAACDSRAAGFEAGFASSCSPLIIGLIVLPETIIIIALIILLIRQKKKRGVAETRFLSFFTMAPFSCVVQDLKGRYLLVNHAFCASVGLPEDRILGKTSEKIGVRIDREKLNSSLKKLIDNGHVENEEISRTIPSGEIRHLIFSSQLTDLNGVKVILSASLDITDRINAEENLRQSEVRFRQLFNLSPVPMALISSSGVLIELNRQFIRTLGYTGGDMNTLEEWWMRAYPDSEYRTMIQQRWNDAILKSLVSDKISDPVDSTVTAKDGSVHNMLVSAVMIGDSMLASLFDITDIRKSQEALRENERLYTQALSATSDAVWEWDLMTNRTYYSPRWYEMLGYDDRELEMSFDKWKELCHPDDAKDAIDRIQATLYAKGGSGYIADFRMRHKDGSWRWIRGRGNVTKRNENGTPTMFSGTNTDITAQRLAEEETRRLHAQIEQTQKIESVGRLAGGVAHDFNNMLGVILGYTELALKNTSADEKLRSQLSQIRRAAERSADLTRQLLAFARQQTATPRVLDPNETVSGMLKLIRRLIGEDIDLKWLPGDGVWPVKIDPTQTDQIIANLCVNARDAIYGTGTIIISTSNTTLTKEDCASRPEAAPGDFIVLSVEDNGCGMDKETQSKIFEPFFTTKDTGMGTGLGLATIYGIVVQNNGFIHVYSEPGKGSSFKIYLPRYTGTESVHEEKLSGAIPQSRGETILLVEDDPRMLGATSALLEQLGYTFFSAQTPAEALALAQTHAGEISLLLTDVIMPEKNGRELSLLLREKNPSLRCLFMSGYTANIISTHGVLDEEVAFLQKPFTLAELGKKIRETLDAQTPDKGTLSRELK